jgi:hypothetical protein
LYTKIQRGQKSDYTKLTENLVRQSVSQSVNYKFGPDSQEAITIRLDLSTSHTRASIYYYTVSASVHHLSFYRFT